MCWCCSSSSSNSSVSCDLSWWAISDYYSTRYRVSLQLFERLLRGSIVAYRKRVLSEPLFSCVCIHKRSLSSHSCRSISIYFHVENRRSGTVRYRLRKSGIVMRLGEEKIINHITEHVTTRLSLKVNKWNYFRRTAKIWKSCSIRIITGWRWSAWWWLDEVVLSGREVSSKANLLSTSSRLDVMASRVQLVSSRTAEGLSPSQP